MNPIGRCPATCATCAGARWPSSCCCSSLGILIALAIDDWMQDRRDAQTERQYLEGIVATSIAIS